MGVIGQNLIIDGARAHEWRKEMAGGATYYVRRRGSNYDCPDCDSLCGYPIPIDVPFERLHSRCVCWAEYHYDEMPGTEDEFKERREEYERLKKDPNYKDVEFNPKNGGLKATHKKHSFKNKKKDQKFFGGKYTGSDLELNCQDNLFRMGKSAILEQEGIKVNSATTLTALDATINGTRMDIRSITEMNENTIRNNIHSKDRQAKKFNALYPSLSTNSLCLYFQDPFMFEETVVRKGLDAAKKLNGSIITRLICVVNGWDDWIIIE